ncbi:zf-HC2 domain-containing protein [Streptomyces sp. NPDC048659]|uniref:zf-HC2 domain-containing protein n=1 Tax=Streptomyces sp. NPDC048659 TaxID=3155489 RepID=UPI00342B294E
MNGVACERLRELGAELALGVLPARERAEAVAHLDGCPECREYVERLTAAGDGLLGLLPEVEPPVGFESRVVAALAPAPAPAVPAVPAARRDRWPRRHRLRLAAVAGAAALACGFGGWAVGTAVVAGAPVVSTAPGHAGLSEAALLSPGGQEVGRVFAHAAGAGRPGWVSMAVDLEGTGGAGAGSGRVRCVLDTADGGTTVLGSFALKDGYGYWAAPVPASASAGAGRPSGVRLLAPDGTVLATAALPAPTATSTA